MSVQISVITAVYNDETYLRRCVESVLNQTFANFEYLIVDDGSTDGTPDLLAELAEQDSRIKVFTQPNSGPATARNIAIRSARGAYVAIQDADDVALPNRLQAQFDQLMQSESNVISCTGFNLIDEYDRIFASHNKVYADLTNNLLQGNTSVCHPTIMLAKELLLNAGGYNPFYAKTEDYDLILRLIENGGHFQKLNECLYNYRIRGDSESSKTSYAYLRRIYENHHNRVNNRPENLTPIVADYKPDDKYVIKRQLREIFFSENFSGFLSMYAKHIFKLPVSEFFPLLIFSLCPPPVKKLLKAARKIRR